MKYIEGTKVEDLTGQKFNKLTVVKFAYFKLIRSDIKGYWELCAPLNTNDERNHLINILKEKFQITAVMQKDNRYFKFHADDSRKITNIILQNIPNELNIIRTKIFKNKTKGESDVH